MSLQARTPGKRLVMWSISIAYGAANPTYLPLWRESAPPVFSTVSAHEYPFIYNTTPNDGLQIKLRRAAAFAVRSRERLFEHPAFVLLKRFGKRASVRKVRLLAGKRVEHVSGKIAECDVPSGVVPEDEDRDDGDE